MKKESDFFPSEGGSQRRGDTNHTKTLVTSSFPDTVDVIRPEDLVLFLSRNDNGVNI